MGARGHRRCEGEPGVARHTATLNTPENLRTRARPGERTFAVACLGFALYALWQAYSISGFAGLTSAGVVPMAAAVLMAVSGLFIVADALRRERDAANTIIATARWLLPPRLLLVVALVAAYAAAMPYVGFVVASTLFLLVSIAVLWRRPLHALGVTAVAMAAIWLVFRIVFQVVLPAGTV